MQTQDHTEVINMALKIVDLSKYRKPDLLKNSRKAIIAYAINAAFVVMVAYVSSHVYDGSILGKRACNELGSKAGSVLFGNIGTLNKIGFAQTCEKYADNIEMERQEYFTIIHSLKDYKYLP